MTRTFVLQRLACSALALGTMIATASTASAEAILAVTTGNVLVSFDSASPGVTSFVALSGTSAGDEIVGIDYRPQTGQLYGVGSLSTLYSIDPTSGVATLVDVLSTLLSGDSFGVDFNPVPDRLRVVSDFDQSLRVNPDNAVVVVDTPLAYAVGDVFAGLKPSVGASAYTNSVLGAVTTTLYAIDFNFDVLVLQSPPNLGVLNTVGDLGVAATSSIGFDISGDSGMAYAAWTDAAAATSSFYTINLGTGAATLVGSISMPRGEQVRGLTVVPGVVAPVPEPTLMSVVGLGLLAGMRHRQTRRRR